MTLIDRELFRFDEIWAAAGHPHGVFKLQPAGPGAADRCAGGRCGDRRSPLESRPESHEISGRQRRHIRASEQSFAQTVPSPCISVCRMDAATGLCEGCFRTLDEIGQWGNADDAVQARRLDRESRRACSRQFATLMKHITFYLDFISPYAYLAFEQLPEALMGLSYQRDLQAGAVCAPC